MVSKNVVYVKSLYAISDGIGNVKFGVAKDPRARLKEMQTGNAHPLQLLFEIESEASHGRNAAVGAYQMEHVIHQWVRQKRMTGEWFAVDYSYAFRLMDSVDDWARKDHWFNRSMVFTSGVIVHTKEADHVVFWPTSDVHERGLVT